MSKRSAVSEAVEGSGLSRSLGLGLLVFYGLGVIIGAGVYVVIGDVIEKAGALAVCSFAVAGATARGVVYEGFPAEAILAGAREQAATLIALTTHGRTGLARWDLGSVAEKVLRGGECPVLVTRSFETAEGSATRDRQPTQATIRRILLPIDAGDLSLAALGNSSAGSLPRDQY